MNLMRLLLFLLFGMMLRRLLKPLWQKKNSQGAPRAKAQRGTKTPAADKRYGDLTEQGIDDADFEEIP